MFQPKNKQFKKVIAQRLRANHFMHHIGFSLTKIKTGYVEGELKIMPHHFQQNKFVHGGVISTISDVVAGLAAYTLVDKKTHVLTAEIKISYLNPGVGQKLIAKGWVLKSGSKLFFCESEVWAIDGKKKTLIAKATTTMAIVQLKL